MLKPISKEFLKQSFELESYKWDDGKISYEDVEIISNVRIDRDRNYNASFDREADVMRNIIIIDKVNSNYTSLDAFKLKSKVTINGVKNVITYVNECYDVGTNEIHHLEVYCE